MSDTSKLNGKMNGSLGKENKIIGIVSAKGGVGKTTTTINLGASAVNLFNKSVLLIDTNLNTGNLCLNLGLTHHPVSMNNVVKDPLSILNSVHKHKSGLHVIPSSLVRDKKKINGRKLKKVLRALSNYDLILLDSAPGIGDDAQIALKASDGLLLVVTPDFPTVYTALKTVEEAKKAKVPILGVVLNRVRNDSHEVSQKYIESVLGLPVVAIVPEDEIVQKSIPARTPAVVYEPRSDASVSYMKLSASILGKKIRKKKFFDVLVEDILKIN